MAKKSCFKIILLIVNTLLLLACSGLIYLGIWSLREYSNYSHVMPEVYMIGLPAGVIFFVGSLLFVVALIGLVATCTEAKCVIATYCTVQLVTFVLLVAAVGLLYACEHVVVGSMEKNLDESLQKYFLDVNVTKEVDYIQQSRKCCGVKSYTDWIGTPWYNNQTLTNDSFAYPNSCCPHSHCTHDFISFSSLGTENSFAMGCYPALSHLLLSKFIICSSVSAAVAVILIAGFAAICGLYNRRTDFSYIGLVDDGAVRV